MITIEITKAKRGYDGTIVAEDGERKTLAVSTDTPVASAARAMINDGWPDDTVITARWRGAAYDSFVPATVRAWAGPDRPFWRE